MNTCVIALGSAHGDDAVAWHIADRLNDNDTLTGTTRVIKTDRIGPEWLDYWAHADRVIVVDAVHTGAAPGNILRCRLWPDPEGTLDAQQITLSSHGLSLAEVLDLAIALEQAPSELLLFGIEADGCRPGDHLSAPVRAVLPLFMDILRATLGCHTTSQPPLNTDLETIAQ